jgi:hypothetical protein
MDDDACYLLFLTVLVAFKALAEEPWQDCSALSAIESTLKKNLIRYGTE